MEPKVEEIECSYIIKKEQTLTKEGEALLRGGKGWRQEENSARKQEVELKKSVKWIRYGDLYR